MQSGIWKSYDTKLGLVALCVISILASCTALEGIPTSPRDVDTLETVTQDGIRLSLRNLVPKRDLIKYPVLLVPDFFLSSDVFFIGPNGGLANYLAARGVEVWTIDLRGQGKNLALSNFSAEGFDWCLDDWLDADIPLALSEVAKNSGKEKAIIIGHGLGGTLALLVASKHPDRVAAVVGLGSPGDLWRPPNRLISALLEHKGKIPPYPVKVQDYLDMTAPFPAQQGFWDILLFNDSGFEGGQARDFFSGRTTLVSSCILKKLADWYDNGRFVDKSGERDLLEGIGKVSQPILLIAGKLDHLYCPGEVLIAYDLAQSKDKEFFIASRMNGLSADYGHLGLLTGPYADRDIYRYILRWVQKRFAR